MPGLEPVKEGEESLSTASAAEEPGSGTRGDGHGFLLATCLGLCELSVNGNHMGLVARSQKRMIVEAGTLRIRGWTSGNPDPHVEEIVEIGAGQTAVIEMNPPKLKMKVVKGPSIDPATARRFASANNETVVDSATGLEWMPLDNGQHIRWEEADRWCSDLRYAGHADWRLPTINELEELFAAVRHLDSGPVACGFSARPVPGITMSCDWFWSSSRDGDKKAWGIYFLWGKTSSRHIASDQGPRRALCVRKPADPS